MVTGQLHDGGGNGNDPARVNHGGLNVLCGQNLGNLQGHAGHGAHGHEEHVALAGLGMRFAGAGQNVYTVGAALNSGDVLAHGALGVANHGGCVVDGYGFAQLLAQGCGVTRGGQVQPGDELQHRQVPHAVVACAVGAGDAGAVQDHGHAGLVQCHIHEQLVETAVQEGCVERDDRMHAAVGEARAHGDGVLLGDAHVNHAVGVALLELAQTHGNEHSAGDADDVLLLIRNICNLTAKDAGPGLGGALGDGITGQRVNRADRVELVVLVRAGGRVTVALLGDGVHDDRAPVVLRGGQGVLHGLLIVAVDGAHVLHAEFLEDPLGHHHVLDAGLHAVQAAVNHLAQGAAPLQAHAHRVEGAVVAVVQANAVHLLLHAVLELGKLVSETADGGRVGAAVIVHDDYDLAATVGGDVVHGFPGHAAGERAVADEHDGVAVVLTVNTVGARNAVGPGDRAGGVRGGNNVVLGLVAVGVAREAALLAQSLKRMTAGHELVHVGLVAGVKEDVVLGGIENAVDAKGQLHNAQVRAQVAAGRRNVRHDELADLVGELLQLLVAQVAQVGGVLDAGQQAGRVAIAKAVIYGGCSGGGGLRVVLLRRRIFSRHTPTLLKGSGHGSFRALVLQ